MPPIIVAAIEQLRFPQSIGPPQGRAGSEHGVKSGRMGCQSLGREGEVIMRTVLILFVIFLALGCLGMGGIAAAGWIQAVSLRQSLDQANARNAELSTSKDELQSQADELRLRLAELEGGGSPAPSTIDCGYDIDIDYTNNGSVSRSLQDFVEAAFAQVEDADWEVWWEGASDTLHYVTDVDEFSYDFFVYFEDPEFETQDSVFFLNWGCWLDMPAAE